MLSPSHLYNTWFQHNLVGYGCSPQAMWRSWPLHIHTQASLYWNLHITEANEPSAWNDRLWAHQLICLLTCITSGTIAVSLTGTASLTMPTKSQLTAQNNTPDELNTRFSLGKGTLRQFFESQWLVTHRGHHDLDHLSENYLDPTCLAPQKLWCLQTKFMAHWVTHGDNHSTHILHPTLGHASVLHKKDGYQSCFSCYH